MNELQAIVGQLTTSTRPAVLATLVTVRGSSYRRPGARLLVRDEGRWGSVSGGCLEEDLVLRARRVLATGVPEIAEYDTTTENDLAWGTGLGCRGAVRILLERVEGCATWPREIAANFAKRQPTLLGVTWAAMDPFHLGTRTLPSLPTLIPQGVFLDTLQPPPFLAVFGAGDDAQPLVHFAKELGWYVVVADTRPAYATASRFPSADRMLVSSANNLVADASLPDDALAIVMSHRYAQDQAVLRDLLARPLRYLGALGPRHRTERLLDEMATTGFNVTDSMRHSLHAPAGLDLGAETPSEIALSILAEMRAVLGLRDGQPLRDRRSPIHG